MTCSEAASPPSAAAAVRAWLKPTAPTRLSRAKSFSYVLTQGSELPSDSTTAFKTSCSVDSEAVVFGEVQETTRKFLGLEKGNLGTIKESEGLKEECE